MNSLLPNPVELVEQTYVTTNLLASSLSRHRKAPERKSSLKKRSNIARVYTSVACFSIGTPVLRRKFT
jgi:hypothetical protein